MSSLIWDHAIKLSTSTSMIFTTPEIINKLKECYSKISYNDSTKMLTIEKLPEPHDDHDCIDSFGAG